MGQRAMIAAMVIAGPDLLIADEPTSALDHALRDQILDLLGGLTDDTGMGLVLISHDLRQVARFADRVLVMQRGILVDRLDAGALAQAGHPYTRALWRAHPSAASYGTRFLGMQMVDRSAGSHKLRQLAPGRVNVAVVADGRGKIGRTSGRQEDTGERRIAVTLARLSQQAFSHAGIQQQARAPLAQIEIVGEGRGIQPVLFREPAEYARVGSSEQYAGAEESVGKVHYRTGIGQGAGVHIEAVLIEF